VAESLTRQAKDYCSPETASKIVGLVSNKKIQKFIWIRLLCKFLRTVIAVSLGFFPVTAAEKMVGGFLSHCGCCHRYLCLCHPESS